MPFRSKSWTITEGVAHDPRCQVAPPRRINEIVKGVRGITADTALRLAAFFGTDAQSWINLQSDYELAVARDAMAEVLGRNQRFAPCMIELRPSAWHSNVGQEIHCADASIVPRSTASWSMNRPWLRSKGRRIRRHRSTGCLWTAVRCHLQPASLTEVAIRRYHP